MSGNPRRDLHAKNRESWNVATRAHNSHKGDQAAFLRKGGSTLHSEELELLGNVNGLRLVHLLCNSGQDTLSLAKLGADVLGVDISDAAIDFAKRLSAVSGIACEFVRSDVYDWLAEAHANGEQFDIAFASYGAVIWLSDLRTWASGIQAILTPGGRFVLVDFHPVPMMFDDDWVLRFSYSSFSSEPDLVVWDDGVGDYVAADMRQADPGAEIPGVTDYVNPNPSYEFNWGIGDILGALIGAGLTVQEFREYPYSNSGHQPGMRLTSSGKWIGPEGLPAMPYMYGIVVAKP